MKTNKKQIQPQDKFVVRMPDGMRDQIAKIAEQKGRSMNAEIIFRLEVGLLSEGKGKEVIDAKRAREVAELALETGEQAFFDTCMDAINAEALRGGNDVIVEDSPYCNDETYWDPDHLVFEMVIDPVVKELIQLGYEVEEDTINYLHIKF